MQVTILIQLIIIINPLTDISNPSHAFNNQQQQ